MPGPEPGEFSLRDHIPSLGAGFRGALIGSVLPIALFYIVLTNVNLTAAVLVASAWTLIVFAVRYRRTRRFDLFSSAALAFLALQTGVGLVSQSTEMYLAVPALEGVFFALLMYGSVVIRQPIIGIIARQFVPIPAELVGTRPYLIAFGLPTVMWASVLLLRAGVRLALLDALPVGQFLVAITSFSWATSLLLLAFSVWFPNRILKPYLNGEKSASPKRA